MPFEPRDLPTVIWIQDEAVAGPFCIHCGYPFSLHSDKLLCPKVPNGILGPCCDCHHIATVEARVRSGRGWAQGTRLEIVKGPRPADTLRRRPPSRPMGGLRRPMG